MPDVVLTNWHVVKETKFVEMKTYDGQETFGKVIAKDVRIDLALIKVQSRGQAGALLHRPEHRPWGRRWRQ